MLEDGPGIFNELNQAGRTYTQAYGVGPIPTQSGTGTPITGLGGETWNLGKSGSSAQQTAAWNWIKVTQTPS